MMKALWLVAALLIPITPAQAAIIYTEVGDAGGTTFCGGLCDHASASELALAQSVTDPFTTGILGTGGGSTGDIFGFYWSDGSAFGVDASGPFNNNK
jgi:hypothetical protein